MKRITALVFVVALVAAVIVSVAGSTPANWKTEVHHECGKLVMSARYTAKAVLNGNDAKAVQRAARLKVRANHCDRALADMPTP